jgi:hypothetical protein
MELTKKHPSRQPVVLSVEDVMKRLPLLKRVVRDIVDCYQHLKKSKERVEELTIISRKFSSCEIEETINSLRRESTECEQALEVYEKEARDLGGVLKDRNRGLTYFYSERGNRKIFLIWELREPDLLSWHELDETFSDRMPVEFSPGARTALDYPRND